MERLTISVLLSKSRVSRYTYFIRGQSPKRVSSPSLECDSDEVTAIGLAKFENYLEIEAGVWINRPAVANMNHNLDTPTI